MLHPGVLDEDRRGAAVGTAVVTVIALPVLFAPAMLAAFAPRS
jgi:hypothetical protein